MSLPEVLCSTHPQNKKYERTVCSANARSIGAMKEECYTSDYCALFKTCSPATELEESVKVHQTSVNTTGSCYKVLAAEHGLCNQSPEI